MIAVTDIDHGDEDGNITHIASGSTIDTKLFTDEEIDNLRLIGSVVDPAEGLSEDEKAKKIADLQAQLAALSADEGAETPGNAAEQLSRDNAVAKLVSEGKSAEQAQKQVDADIKKAQEAAAKQGSK